MTGADILDAIIDDSFESGKRTIAVQWMNAALGEIWNPEDWIFKRATDAVTVTADSYSVTSLPTDFGAAIDLFRSNGDRLEPIVDYQEYANRYVGTDQDDTGVPEAFCAQYGTIVVGPKSSETDANYLLVYEKVLTAMADNSTACPLPSEMHLAVVFGAKEIGFLGLDAAAAAAAGAVRDRIVASARPTYLRAQARPPRQWAIDPLC